MAGNGDLNVPKAWTVGTPTITTGAHGTPPAQGDVLGDGGDPDLFLGSFTLQIVTPTLGVAALPAVKGNGDAGDIFGAPDLAGEAQARGLTAFNTGAPSLVPAGTAAPSGNGDLGDTGGPTTTQGEPNDSNAGFGTLTSFNSGSPTLGVGSIPQNAPHGDIDDVQGSDSGPIIQVVWNAVAPSLVTQAITKPNGQGDIPNPFSWQDAAYFLTSQPYPIVVVETMVEHGGATGGDFYVGLITPHDNMTVAGGLTGGVFFASLVTYTNWPRENMTEAGAITGGSLTLGLLVYTNWPRENMTAAGGLTGGDFHTGLVTYSNWPQENVTAAGSLTGGSLT